jgi:hypothetical protein
MEREKHRADAAGAVSKARVNVKEGNFAEARAAHGNALVEYEMAGLKEVCPLWGKKYKKKLTIRERRIRDGWAQRGVPSVTKNKINKIK